MPNTKARCQNQIEEILILRQSHGLERDAGLHRARAGPEAVRRSGLIAVALLAVHCWIWRLLMRVHLEFPRIPIQVREEWGGTSICTPPWSFPPPDWVPPVIAKVECLDSSLEAGLLWSLLFCVFPEEVCVWFPGDSGSSALCIAPWDLSLTGGPRVQRFLSSFIPFFFPHKCLGLSQSYIFLQYNCMKIYHLCLLSSSPPHPAEKWVLPFLLHPPSLLYLKQAHWLIPLKGFDWS